MGLKDAGCAPYQSFVPIHEVDIPVLRILLLVFLLAELASLIMLALASQSQGPLQASSEAGAPTGSTMGNVQETQPWIG